MIVKDMGESPVFTAYSQRAAKECTRLWPTPAQFKAFLADIEHMWATELPSDPCWLAPSCG